jgi:hypothetical protein
MLNPRTRAPLASSSSKARPGFIDDRGAGSRRTRTGLNEGFVFPRRRDRDDARADEGFFRSDFAQLEIEVPTIPIFSPKVLFGSPLSRQDFSTSKRRSLGIGTDRPPRYALIFCPRTSILSAVVLDSSVFVMPLRCGHSRTSGRGGRLSAYRRFQWR